MASASIESTVTAPIAKATVTNASRDDLGVNDVVLLNSVNNGTAYTWSLAYVPEGSAAAFSGSALTKSPGSFTVDEPGPYLVRLVLWVPTVTVLASPIPAGSTLTINGTPLTAVAGGRTPGANNFNGSLGTPALIAAEIVAALNDGANSFSTFITPTVAVGSAQVNLCPVVSGASITAASSSTLMFFDANAYSEQFVRLRALTAVGSLKLVAAGERVDVVPVPVDITISGWADEQNYNLLTLLGFVSTTSTTGRVLYVDPVNGDFNTIQAAMDYANSQLPGSASQWVVLVRPGLYQEDLTFYPFVHLFGWPGGQGSKIVQVQNATPASHTIALPLVGDEVILSNLYFDQSSTTSNPVLSISGAGTVAAHKSVFLSGGSGTLQGPAVQVDASTATFNAFDCRFSSNSAASVGSFALTVLAGGAAFLRNCRILVRGVGLAEGSSLFLRDCEVTVAGTYGIRSLATSLTVEYSQITGATSQSIAVNPTGSGAAGAVSATIRWSRIQDLLFNTTAILGATTLQFGATEHGTFTFPGGTPGTLMATTPSDSLFFDNTTTGLTAENVQDALDEIYTFTAAVRTLDDAYDGGDPGPTGSGRTIVADAGAVQIVDATSPSDPIPPANTNGGLEVVGRVRVGAIGKPELELDPNPYGNGPLLLLGREIWANDAPHGSTASILGNATGTPTFHNYNLTLGTSSAAGGSDVGRVNLRGGDSLGAALDAGSVFVQAGRGSDAGGGDGGSIYITPGDSVAGTGGGLFLVRPEDATPATLTAAGAFVGGVAGLIRFASDLGAVEVSVGAGDNLAAVIAKFDATGLVTAVDSGGGVLQLTTVSTGVNAEVYFLNADVGVDTALGVFAGQAMVAGTWPSVMEVQVSAANEITFGPNDPNPMVYNSTTGKLTVPGLIDPIGLILDNTIPINADPGKGIIFVGDGTLGTTLGDFYFRYESGALQNISAAASGSTSIAVQNGGSGIGNYTTLNFTGSGVLAADGGGGVSDITITSGSLLRIEEEGTPVETDTSTINFTGAAVTASSTGPNQVTVNVTGSSLLTGIAQQRFLASAFTGGTPSSITLSNTLDSNAVIQGLVVLYRNGKADMVRVVGVPTTEDEYRVVGTTLQVGTDITVTSNTYLIVYPHL